MCKVTIKWAKNQNLFWFFRTWVTWATANVTTNNWFHHHGSVTALQSPYPRCPPNPLRECQCRQVGTRRMGPPNPLKGECQCRQVGTRLGTSAARQCLAHRFTQIYTDLERFLSVIMSHTEFTESHRIILCLLCILCSFIPPKSFWWSLMSFDAFGGGDFFHQNRQNPSKITKLLFLMVLGGLWWGSQAGNCTKLHKLLRCKNSQAAFIFIAGARNFRKNNFKN